MGAAIDCKQVQRIFKVVMKVFCNVAVIIVQVCNLTNNYQTVYLQWANCLVCRQLYKIVKREKKIRKRLINSRSKI